MQEKLEYELQLKNERIEELEESLRNFEGRYDEAVKVGNIEKEARQKLDQEFNSKLEELETMKAD